MPWKALILRARYRRVKRFLSGTSHAVQIQRRVLLDKLRRNADSDFGRKLGFAHIRSVADFRRAVPISKYDDYGPYIERVKQGDVTAMFGPGTKVLMFSMTSGTTGQSKYIPITREFVNEYRRGWNLWGSMIFWDHRPLLHRVTLQLVSDWQKDRTAGGIPCGSISGLAAEMSPLVSRTVFVNLRPLMKIVDPLAKHYAALRVAMAKPHVGSLITANPSTLVEMARMADRERESLIRDIFDGTLSGAYEIPAEVRRALRWQIGLRRRRRARELERLAERWGRLLPRDFWPQLEVLSVWTGGSVGAYLPQLRQYYGDLPVRDHGLSASEGRMTIPIEDNTSAGLLDYTSQYFEFIPEDEHGKADPTVLEAHELEPGHKYFVILTTSSGFYRYDIHDLVECVGFRGEAPLLKFLNKGSHFSSITGEKLSEFQVVEAVSRAFQDLGFGFGLFTVAPRWGDPPGYMLLIEPGPHMQRHAELAVRIDEHLSRMNMEYAERLQSRRLQPMILQTVPDGAWEVFRDQRLRRGGSLEQYKHPCLTNDLDFVQGLNDMLQEAAAVRSGGSRPLALAANA